MALAQGDIDSIARAALDAFADLEGRMRGRGAALIIEDLDATVGGITTREQIRAELGLISRASKRDIERVVRDTLQRAAEVSLGNEAPTYAAARLAGLIAPYGAAASSEALNEILRAAVANAQGMANLIRTKAEQAVIADVMDALDAALLSTVVPNGVGIEEATRKAIGQIIGQVSNITYAQPDGRVITQSLYGAVSRAISTSSNQLTGELTLTRAAELGVETFEVSAHLGARPEHAEWQGGIYSLQELYDVCGLDDVTGLLGANCRHTFWPYIEGLSEPTDWSFADDPTGEQYELSQRQRESERNIRRYKTREKAYAETAKSATDPQTKAWAREQQQKARDLKRKWQAEADRVAAKRGGVRRKAREIPR